MSDTADVNGGKPFAVWSQSISGANAIDPLVAFYDIHGRKREVLFFYSAPDTTRDYHETREVRYFSRVAFLFESKHITSMLLQQAFD
jgi:hypothetical protein